ncbi:AraC family transcriptional regulator [Solirubrobacter soli]|uniref:AraC family transcriptional regulator n=1 Tax=Solirubrobacter soli TaxID=363832 RepID=UPI0012FBD6E5|nr:AraC family transcriptional regulator [Solirubrobacter soli]
MLKLRTPLCRAIRRIAVFIRWCCRISSRILLETAQWRLGEFRCAPGDPAWDEVNTNMGAWPHVVFPRSHVLIEQDGARPVLTTPNHVVFYKPHQLYRRGLRDPRGDRSVWLEVSPALLEETPVGPLGPSDARTYALAVALATPPAERLVAEEAAMRLLDLALRGAGVRPEPRRAGTLRVHAELVEAAKELLIARVAEPPVLSEVAAALYVSPFHLARVFRARTGFSLAGYVHGLRLRRAVDRLAAEPSVDLSRLALELGYCSSSHFTDRFRAAFGCPPSALRGTQLRTIVEARRPHAA